jgi:hypothetical protein
MRHDLFNSQTFNYLTARHTNEGFELSGETKEGIEIGDEIQNPNDGKQYLPIKKIIERRDSKSYPAGNNYFYRVVI